MAVKKIQRNKRREGKKETRCKRKRIRDDHNNEVLQQLQSW
ncbi:MAG: hypothetical protein ACI8RD_003102 [Bacillariaceae sp.]|jgi:hypothetical protein